MLDGALFTDARARRAPLGARARPWNENLTMGSYPTEGRARRGRPVARPWGVGRGEPGLVCEHPSSAPRVLTVPNELTNECLWGGSAPPNGSRLSCGRLARWRQGVGRLSVPARAQHSASVKAITARQLQALVRPCHAGCSSAPRVCRGREPRRKGALAEVQGDGVGALYQGAPSHVPWPDVRLGQRRQSRWN